jgi:hypothetical protein
MYLRVSQAGFSPTFVHYYEAQVILMYQCNITDANCDSMVLNATPSPSRHRRASKEGNQK